MSNNGRVTLCPYYRNEKGFSITCEDVYRRFETKTEKKKHKNTYCCEAWQKCPYAKDLNRLYENMEGEKMNKTEELRQKCNAQGKEIKKMATMLGKAEKKVKELTHEVEALTRSNKNLQGLYVKWQDKAKEAKESELKAFNELNILSDIITGRMVYLMTLYTDGKLDEREFQKWAEDKEFRLYAAETEKDEDGREVTAVWGAEVK